MALAAVAAASYPCAMEAVALDPGETKGLLSWLAGGLRMGWRRVLLVFLVNLGLAALLSVEDERPFIHPFVTVQATGFAIAYWVQCFAPWAARRPMWVLTLAVTIGMLTGTALTILIKVSAGLYRLSYYIDNAPHIALSTLYLGFIGLLVSSFIVNQVRDARSRDALRQAEADRLLLARQAAEAELRLMQAQVEPHFLFNTLSNVQYLVETDAKTAAAMLGHLTSYLRAAIPQLRQRSTTLAQEARLAESYLAILRMRMGRRLRYRIEVPEELGTCVVPPMMLLSLLENAIEHGVEPSVEGGEVVLSATRGDDGLCVVVSDTGQGLAGPQGSGMGLASIRERLRALYGDRGRLTLEANVPTGARATLLLPEERHG